MCVVYEMLDQICVQLYIYINRCMWDLQLCTGSLLHC